MTTQTVENVELFLEAELESLEFVPEELENIESELYPNLDSISLEKVAKDLESYFEGDVEEAGLEVRGRGGSRTGSPSRSAPPSLPSRIPQAPPSPNDRIAQIRARHGVNNGRNIAFAIVRINGRAPVELVGVSSQGLNAPVPPVSVRPAVRVFTATSTNGHNREYDSEIKILDEVASRYGQNQNPNISEPQPTGSVYLFTERPACPSCSNVFRQFRKKFPNISLTVQHGNR